MKNQKKQKYVPCEVNVIKFNVEQGFAASGDAVGVCGNFATNYNATQLTTLKMNATNNHYRNEDSYLNNEVDWFI